MSTTHRSDSALLPGYHHSGDRGQGVLASTIPTSGLHGPAIPYPGLNLPADAGLEIMVSILTVPSALTLFRVDEFGVVEAEGPDGVHIGTYRLWAGGVDAGTSTWRVTFGPVAQLSGNLVFDPIVASGSLQGVLPSSGTLSGTLVLDPILATGSLAGVLPPSGELTGTLVLEIQASGALVGYTEPTVPGRTRTVVVGRSRTPVHLAPLDVDEVDDVVFDFTRVVDPGAATVLDYEVTAEARRGADAGAQPLFQANTRQVLARRCMQRVTGQRGLVGVTYLLRCVAVLSDGRRLTGEAFIQVRRKA
jgi:hypothetical protein